MTLTIIYTLSFMDRIMIGILMQPIKEEFLLSDTQLGFLTGIAFALFYATMGIPIARLADRGNRVTIISITLALWGGMVMLCGLVTNFMQLILVRIGAAVGEAGCFPPSYSLIGDYYPVSERTRALSIYMMGISISIAISYMLAGWINDAYGWRTAFLFVGLPGLLIAIVVKFTLREPRCDTNKYSANQVSMPSLGKVFSLLWRQKTYRYLVAAITLINFAGIGVGQWYATFFIRSHSMTTGELGVWLGLILGISGAVGTYLGGYIVGRYMANDVRAQLRFMAVSVALFFPFTLMMLLASNKHFALFMLIPGSMLALSIYGPVFSIIQQLVSEKIRAMAIAVTLLILNLVGMGLGPQVVGIISDYLTPMLGVDALRIAMVIVTFVAFGSSYYFWIAGKTINKELSEKQCHQVDSCTSQIEPEPVKVSL